MRIARRHGGGAVTVRGVAAALDVTPMALYHHVGSVDGLRDAVVDQILLDARVAMNVEGDTVGERVSTFARQARTALARYPGAAAVLLAPAGRGVTSG
jgi:AcrR family transcriptional regulator